MLHIPFFYSKTWTTEEISGSSVMSGPVCNLAEGNQDSQQVVKNTPVNVGDMGSSPGPGRSHMPRSN